MADSKTTRTRDDMVKIIGEDATDNYLSFPDERSHAVLVKSVTELTAERNRLRERVAELTLTETERRILIELDGHKMLNDGERGLIRRLLDANRPPTPLNSPTQT